MYDKFLVDNVTYSIPFSYRREPRIEWSDVSGLMMNRRFYNDPIATYMDVIVSMAVPVDKEDSYNSLFEVLSNPTSEHIFVLPHGKAEITTTEDAAKSAAYITIYGRVERLNDSFYDFDKATISNKNYEVTVWKNISFRIVASRPWKEPV